LFSNNDSLSESLTILRESLDQIEGEVSLRNFEPSLGKFVNDEESINVTLSIIAVPSPLVLPEGSLKMVYAVDASSIILGECGKGVIEIFWAYGGGIGVSKGMCGIKPLCAESK